MSVYAQKHDNCPTCRCTEPVRDLSIKWILLSEQIPEDEQWCVVWHKEDWHIMYWLSGCGCFDSPDFGFVEDIEKWYPIPNES